MVTADAVLTSWLMSRRDARGRKRAKLSLPALLWPFEPKYRHLKEVRRVRNFTRNGLYFTTELKHYFVGMKVMVTFPFCRQAPTLRDFLGKVVRIENLADGTLGIALRFIF
jgi:hypothetical protein